MKIFYNQQMVVSDMESTSKSAGKPKMFVDQVKVIYPNISIVESGSISKKDLELAHSSEYIESIFSRSIYNGFMNYHPEVPNSCLFTIGSMFDAACESLNTKSINCSPTSGFHHSGYDFAGGFCTFNGLIVVAQLLKEKCLATKIGILDLDFHFGNGTADIIDKLQLDYIKHHTLGDRFNRGASGQDYLNAVSKALADLADCDIILYQAGADLSINDPLGGILTDDELVLRDKMVFSLNKPVVWNLAGGYQLDYQKTLDIHIRTLLVSLNKI